MLELAICLRSLQLYAHHAHHVCARTVFNQDHEFLAEIYTKAEQDYDDVIERHIGLNGDASLDEAKILSAAATKVASLPMKGVKENKELLKACQELIKYANQKIEVICKEKVSQGTLQLVGDIANKNEALLYKLGQRLK